MITKNIVDVTDNDRPFIFSRGNGDGTVTLFYPEDEIPVSRTPTEAEIAVASAQATKYVVDSAAAMEYSKLKSLMAMTPAQVQTWVAANVTNLAQAQDAITTLAVAVGVLARRL